MENFICPRCGKSVWRNRERHLSEYRGRMSLVCEKPCYMTIFVTPVEKLVVRENSEGIGSFPIHTVRKIDRQPWLKRLASNILSHEANVVMILSSKESVIEKPPLSYMLRDGLERDIADAAKANNIWFATKESIVEKDGETKDKETLHPTPTPEYITDEEVSIKDAAGGLFLILFIIGTFAVLIYMISHVTL